MPRKPSSNSGDVQKTQVTGIEIRFYRANEKPFGAFSNLYPRAVEFNGELYPTAEHAYQAGKAAKAAVRKWVLSAPSPALVAMAAHGLYSWDVVPDWATIKFDRMRGVLRAKYQQHEDLRILLLSTGDARLVESANTNNAVNRLWGEVNGKGQNMLGKLLMEVRTELRRGGVDAPKQGRPIPAKKVPAKKVVSRKALSRGPNNASGPRKAKDA
jgi:ribA/ribD-fused uncharacterized protein